MSRLLKILSLRRDFFFFFFFLRPFFFVFDFFFSFLLLTAGYFVLSSRWMASYSGSVGGVPASITTTIFARFRAIRCCAITNVIKVTNHENIK